MGVRSCLLQYCVNANGCWVLWCMEKGNNVLDTGLEESVIVHARGRMSTVVTSSEAEGHEEGQLTSLNRFFHILREV